jgi:dephospho-CoA kinase
MSGPALIVGLTGGIAAGKSAVARHFAALGVPVHDADVAAREVIAPGSAGLQEIIEHFGAGALDATGNLDRGAMRERVFADPSARRVLESIIHPRVRQWLLERTRATAASYGVLAIPLLVEHLPDYHWIDRILVVDAPEALRMERLLVRDRIDTELARRMLAQQVGRTERLAVADDVLDNSEGEADLARKVAALHERYLALAEGRPPRRHPRR